MKNLILILVLFLIPINAVAADDYYYDGRRYDRMGDKWFNNDYHNPVTYEVNGNQITGSDGSSYTIHGQQEIQDTRTGKVYMIDGNRIRARY